MQMLSLIVWALALVGIAFGGDKAEALEMISKNDDGTFCSTCVVVVTMAEVYITDPENVQWIEDYIVREVCPQLPRDYVPQCKSFAILVAENLAIWIRDNVSPTDVCRQSGFCVPSHMGGRHNGLPAFDFTHFVDFMIKQKIAQGNFDACQYCKETFELLSDLLNDLDNQKKIIDGIKKICKILGDYEDVCILYTESYVQSVIMLLANYLQPGMCTDLGYCEATTLEL